MKYWRSGVWCAVSLLAAGCVEAPVGEEAAQVLEQPIINGTLDTTRQAVVAILNNNSICTGTIVQKDQGVGWVLTAAHCVDDRRNPPLYVVQGNDFNSASATVYEVIDWEVHPAYTDASTGYDFAVIRFAGASSATPVIPVVTGGDGLSRGSSVTSVGYGRTTTNPNATDDNSRRWQISKSLSELDSLTLVYSLSGSGICFGDSGGPVLATVGGVERVVGVHSAVTGDCNIDGYSGRVSGVYGSWLSGVLGGEVEQTCDLCRQVALSGDGACTGSIEACTSNASCNALLTCLNNCTTDACSQRCADNNAAGVDRYLAIFSCVCEDACPDVCAGDASCPGEAACGVAFADATCNSCLERSCCAEMQDCADDSTCLGCLSTDSAACANNNNLSEFGACATDQCATQCGIEVPECGFSGGDDAACGTCLEGSCCAEGAACADDAACVACLSGEGTGCESNRRVNDFVECLAACDGDPCGLGGSNNNTGNNNASNNSAGNNSAGNNSAGNNSAGNNSAGNNSAGNNSAGNNGGFLDENNGGFLDEDDGGGGGSARATCAAVPVGGAAGLEGLAVLGVLGLVGLLRRR